MNKGKWFREWFNISYLFSHLNWYKYIICNWIFLSVISFLMSNNKFVSNFFFVIAFTQLNSCQGDWRCKIHRMNLCRRVGSLNEGPVGWGCKIHRLNLCRRVGSLNEGPVGWDCKIHRMNLCRRVGSHNEGPLGWGYWIHRLLVCKDVRPPPQRVSCIWY